MDFSKIKLNSGKEEKVPEKQEEQERGDVPESSSTSASGLRFHRFPPIGDAGLSNPTDGELPSVEADSSAVASESLVSEPEVSEPLVADEDDGEQFDELLEDLLSDDEEELGGGEAGGPAWDDQLADLLGDDEDEAFVTPAVSRPEGPPSSDKRAAEGADVEAVEGVLKGAGPDGFVAPGAGRGSARRKARAGKRVRLHSKSSSYRSRKGDLESEMGARGGLEYLVDADGVLVPAKKPVGGDADRFGRLVEAAEAHKGVKLPEGFVPPDVPVVADAEVAGAVVYPWSTGTEAAKVRGEKRGKERLNQEELAFYRSLGARKSEVVAGEFGRELRTPVGVREEKTVRVARKSLARQGVGGHVGYANHLTSAVTLRDQEVLQFLAKFKYATAKQLSNISGVTERTSTTRLTALKRKGLVESIRMWGATPVWVLTGAGMVLSGFDLPIQAPGKISYALIGHQFVVNNTASNLMGGQVNVLHLGEFPVQNRVDSTGRLRWGEEVVSETEIQSSFSKMRLLTKADVYRPLVINSISRAFREWEEAGKPSESPEFMFGNEYMWMLFPPKTLGQVYHAPDFVVRRPRNADGSPESIAVEVEINSKAEQRYDRVLRVFKADNRMYKKVIWVCKSMQAAKSLEKVAKEIGLWQEGRIDIVPITTRDGIFEGRDLWTI